MIISHRHKYLFIEIPHTGTTAISQELRDLYDGEEILRKHSHYYEFERIATEVEKGYFVFGGIRNPLDIAVTKYVKFKTDHKNNYTNPARRVENGGSISRTQLKRFEFAQQTEADFSAFFRKYYRLPYNSISCMSLHHCNMLIRYEHLQDDFAETLKKIGIGQERPLPRVNKTGAKKQHFTEYYTPEIIPQAKRSLGPYMSEWGYDFPTNWGAAEVSAMNRTSYQLVNQVRFFYWKHIKWGDNGVFRKLREYR